MQLMSDGFGIANTYLGLIRIRRRLLSPRDHYPIPRICIDSNALLGWDLGLFGWVGSECLRLVCDIPDQFRFRVEEIGDPGEEALIFIRRGRGPIDARHPIATFDIDQLADSVAIVHGEAITMADDGLAVDPPRARPLDRLALATDGAGFDAAGATCLIAPDIRCLATQGEGQLAAEVDVRRGVQGVAEVYGDRIGHPVLSYRRSVSCRHRGFG